MKKFAYFIYLLVFILVFAEIGLRSFGSKPGYFQKFDGFEVVDSLYEFKNYTTDEYGIYKFSSYVTDSVFLALNNNASVNFFDKITNKNLLDKIDWGTDHVEEIYSNFLELNLLLNDKTSKGKYTDNEFFKYVQFLSNTDSISNLDSLILNYTKKPFNNEGFRGIDFLSNIKDSNKPKVLLVGDSFTYGQTAKPFFYSFADLLLARGYIVFNAGISGTDPAQYAAIVDKYVPELKPDLVIINFCLNNDLMSFDREPHQSRPHEYLTNSGFFYSAPIGDFLSVEQAYNYYSELSKIPNVEKNGLNLLISKFAVTTQVWGVMYKLGFVKHPILDNYYNSLNPGDEDRRVFTQKYVDKILEICQKNDIPIKLAMIPDIAYQPDNYSTLVINDSLIFDVFSNYEYSFPDNFVKSDFAEDGDIHFNNKGHLKYANFLDSLIQQTLQE